MARELVTVRSYRAVLDDVERRIYRVDRWRLPLPGGIEVRAILYTVSAFVALAACDALPLVGALLGELPAGIRYLALPVGLGWGLAAWRIDGRAPHYALVAAVRFLVRPKTLAGLRSTKPVGVQLAPVAAVQVAPAGDEPGYRRGRVRGPASVTLRYPARLALERAPGDESVAPEPGAERIVVAGVSADARPLRRGRAVRVAAGAEVRFE